MAELSFGHNLRAKRKEVVNNTVSFLPWAAGCFTGCAPGQGVNSLESSAPANTIHFNNAPAKMLAVALHEYGSPHQLKVQLCNLPRELREGELLIQVQAAGVNPTDCKLRTGALQQLYPLSLPCILGCDFSGVVIKAGAKTKFSPGDVVFGRQTLDRIREVNGTYAEYVVVDAEQVAKKPDNISFEQAAAVPWAGLAAFASLVHVGGLPYKNDTGGRRAVLILGGSGGVGTFAVQISKHYLRCHTTVSCSSSNADLVKKLGADDVLDYNQQDFLKKARLPELGQGRKGFSLVLDCVGGDDYWEMCQELLMEGGTYVTLVGPERHGGEYNPNAQISVGSAMQMQMQTGIRKGLGLLGASKKYALFTPSMSKGSDLETLSELLRDGKLAPVVKKVWSMYDVIDSHELIETHHCVGKTVVQVRKGLPQDDGSDAGTDPDGDEEEEVDLSKMELDKKTMKLVPKNQKKDKEKEKEKGKKGKKGKEDSDEDDLDALRTKQMEVAKRLQAMKKKKPADEDDEVLEAEGADEEDREWLKNNPAASAMMGFQSDLKEGSKGKDKRAVKWGQDQVKDLHSESDGAEDSDQSDEGGGGGGGRGRRKASEAEEWNDDGASKGGAGGKLSKKEQYRLAVEEAKHQMQTERVGIVPTEALNDSTFKSIQEAKMSGKKLQDESVVSGLRKEVDKTQQDVLESQGAIRHSGVLRKKKEDHGRFEDPYKVICLATLEDGILTLRLTHNGEVVGLEEHFNLGDGWKLLVRDDKKDRFTLIRTGPLDDSNEVTQVTLRSENKAEGEIWVEKLKQTAMWFNDRTRKAAGLRAGAGPPMPPANINPIAMAPSNASLIAAKKNSPGVNQCGVGMVLKQTPGGLVVKKLVDGAPAILSGSIEIGDILLKVDSKSVVTAEEAAAAILGDQGTAVNFQMQREREDGKILKFPLKLIRNKPK